MGKVMSDLDGEYVVEARDEGGPYVGVGAMLGLGTRPRAGPGERGRLDTRWP